ncbi:MAG TPA: imidazoleglycerol-phosphate dehydratase [Candidatus Baltobacteraceae bacterium]|nr:imidazoleglycerol-phosphate dehydratase [Candidatus Baltobacteraceae bacterium]
MRSAARQRQTSETSVRVSLALDGEPSVRVETGIVMLDHLLGAFAFHARAGLEVEARSLDAIRHHLIEDVAIVLGGALDDALGDRSCIARYGAVTLPMDDALVRCAVDLGGRIYARTALDLRAERIEDLETVMIPHVVGTLAANARATIHLDRLAGEDPHHLAEAAFKALGRACAAAWSLDGRFAGVASTKGLLV